MNARIQPIRDRSKLTEHQRNNILRIAKDRQDPYAVRAEKLRGITYCTDACKFEVLEARCDKELYDCLYDLYFGTVKTPEKLSEPKPIETHNENKRTILDGFTEVEPTKIIEQPKPKRGYSGRMSEADSRKLIHLYLKGPPVEELARMYDRTVWQIKQKISDCKRSKKYRGMFRMDIKKEPEIKPEEDTAADPQEQEKKFEEIIESVDAGKLQKAVPVTPDELPKAFTATGKGFLSTDSGIKLDEEPITALLRQKIKENGLAQFYAEVEIVIRPVAPTGMVVAVEE